MTLVWGRSWWWRGWLQQALTNILLAFLLGLWTCAIPAISTGICHAGWTLLTRLSWGSPCLARGCWWTHAGVCNWISRWKLEVLHLIINLFEKKNFEKSLFYLLKDASLHAFNNFEDMYLKEGESTFCWFKYFPTHHPHSVNHFPGWIAIRCCWAWKWRPRSKTIEHGVMHHWAIINPISGGQCQC